MPRQQPPPLKGGQHLFQNADMEIDQLATALISLTFGTKTFFDESEDLISLDPPHIVFPRRHRRDGESFLRVNSLTSDSTILQPVNTSRLVNKELDLNCAITYVYHPVTADSFEPKVIITSATSA